MKDLGQLNLKRTAIFTDIHFGKKSELHNKDCLEFIDFLYNYVKNNNNIDSLMFMGDWFDKRDSINVSTLNYSYKALEKLNSLGIPMLFLLGNHDLYLRNNRDIHSLIYFHQFDHCTLIDEPTRFVCNGKNNLLLPYIFSDEYVPISTEVNNSHAVFSHLELKGFVLTGTNVVLEHGHDQNIFSKPKRIFSGHFHKRQSKGNVFYIGNPFPFDFSDANDTERGFAVYDHIADKVEYINNTNAPSYTRTTLSNLLENHSKILRAKGVVRCLVDTDISMEESIAIKETLMETYGLREFTLEEVIEEPELTNDVEIDEEKFQTTESMIKALLDKLDSDKYDKKKIIKIYEEL